MTYEQFIERLDHRRPCGGGVTARCPAHDDRHNSLSVTRGRDRILVKCHAGCSIEKILEALGLTLADLFYESRNGTREMTTRSSSEERLTLEQFARAKGFTCEFLREHGVSEEKQRLVFHYLTLDGQRAARQRIRLALAGDRRFIWSKSDGRPIAYGVWRIAEWRKHSVTDLYLIEGESDTLTLWLHNFAAIGLPGADNCSLLQSAHVSWARRIYIVRENDQGGEVFERGLTGRLAELQYPNEVRVIEMSRAGVKDPNDLHVKFISEPGAFESEFQALIEMSRAIDLPVVGVKRKSLASVTPERIQWLWSNRIPLGELVLFAGESDLGKSTVAFDLAARLSRGAAWPDGAAGFAGGGGTLIITDENRPETVIRPRVEAAGGDLERIEVFEMVREPARDGEIRERGFCLATDIPMLARALEQTPGIRLVILDPVSSYLGRTDSHTNAEVRGLLSPLSRLAHDRRVCILLVTHLNKGNGPAKSRITGSVAFEAAARAGHLFTRDPDDEDARLFLPFKINLSRPGLRGLRYRIIETARGVVVEWLGLADANADEILAQEVEQRREMSKLATARQMLLDILSTGAQPEDAVRQQIFAAGVSERTYKTARARLGVTSLRRGYGREGGWYLALPNTGEDAR
jgi:hypothetical protein